MAADVSSTKYNMSDNSPQAFVGPIYYRIKETAIQGDIHYSTVVKPDMHNEAGGLTIYPNPANGEFILSGYAASAGLLELKVLDFSGKLIRLEKWIQSKGNYSRDVSIDKAPNGMYWLEVKVGERRQRVGVCKL